MVAQSRYQLALALSVAIRPLDAICLQRLSPSSKKHQARAQVLNLGPVAPD